MSKQTSAWPIDQGALPDHYKEVESFQRERTRASQRTSKVLAAVAAASIITNVGLAWALASMLPLTKLVPIYLWVRADGSVDSSVTLSRLPATQSEAVVNAQLWEFVRLYEGYSFDSARYGYDAVSRMSNDTVRANYQKWFNYPNPSSPQVTLGQKGQIDIEHISSARIAPNVEQVRYRRIVTLAGQNPVVTTWTATLQYQTVTNLPAASRLTNPGGVIVTAYQSGEDGAQ